MIEKLEFLVAIAREQNFRRAAEACGVAQPTLSAGIKSLEESLGLQLVRRSSRYQGLTPEGERVLIWARRLAGDFRAMRQDVHSFRHGLSGQLRLGVVPTALPYTPVITRRFRAMHPGVQITVLSRTSNEIIEQLNGLELEGGITYLGAETIGRATRDPAVRRTLPAPHSRRLASRRARQRHMGGGSRSFRYACCHPTCRTAVSWTGCCIRRVSRPYRARWRRTP